VVEGRSQRMSFVWRPRTEKLKPLT
jgi:hypothetical protein